MPHLSQHQTSNGTHCTWSNVDVGFLYGHTVCPDNCETSRVVEDAIATRPASTTRVRWRTTTVVEHEALIPASAIRVALDLVAGTAGHDPGGAVPDAVGRLLARHETVDTGDGNEPTETRRLVTPAAPGPRPEEEP